jgi:hypothetical protein
MSESERPAEYPAADAPEAQLVTADARRHFAAIRSEWLAPLLAELTDQADRIAQLEAALAAQRRRAEAAEAERDALRAQPAPPAPGPVESTAPVPQRLDDSRGLRPRGWRGRVLLVALLLALALAAGFLLGYLGAALLHLPGS